MAERARQLTGLGRDDTSGAHPLAGPTKSGPATSGPATSGPTPAGPDRPNSARSSH